MAINPIKKPVEILLGEDNPGDVYLVRSSLTDSQLNHSFYHVNDGEEVMAYLHHQKGYQNVFLPDLILLDLNLPKKNGFEVLAEIKADPKLKIIPVIILTSSNTAKDIQKSYQLCANSYIVKPADYFAFFQAIKNLEMFWLDLVKLPFKSSVNTN
ncbi:MAG: response regulator [Pleurocapsa sp. MO_192.B19]|nr:response regulator [Pleurocapsa sp. MO_192.B19]